MSTASPLLERWQQLTGRAKTWAVVGIVIAAYLISWLATGKHGYIHQKAPIGIILLGCVFGSVTALGAFGIILIYRANRFINFANGALGSMVGILAIGLVNQHGLNYWIALPAAVIVGIAVGAATELVIRRFRHSSRLLVTVASVGLAQVFGFIVLIIASKVEHFTALSGAFSPPFSASITIDVYRFTSSAILIVAVVPVVIAFLAWFLLRTDAGIAVRAAAENEDRALLLGIPVRRLSTIVWMISGGLTCLAFMLQAPLEGVTPPSPSLPSSANDPTVLVPMLAAAVIARMESLPVAFGAAIGLGVMDQVVRWDTTKSPSFVYVVYLVVIVVALLAQSGKLSRAQDSETSSWSSLGVLKPIPDELRRIPEVIWSKRILIVGLLALFIWVPHTWDVTHQYNAGIAMTWAMIGVSLVILTGWGGQISLGQIGIAGVSGMIAGNLIARSNSDFFLVIFVAGLAGAAVALLVGLPALRIKGLFLAATTLAMAVALDQYFLNTDTFPQFIPKGSLIPKPLLLDRFNLNNNYELYIVCLAFLVLSVLVTVGLRKARAARVVIGTRDNERAAASVAVPTTGVKLASFAIAGAIAGIAGALYVLLLGALNPGEFPAGDSITVFSYAVIGGLGSVTGAISGVLFFEFLGTQTWLGIWRDGINGLFLVLVLLFLPGGIGQALNWIRDQGLRLIANRRGILVPSLVADKRQPGGAPEDDLLATIAARAGADGNGAAEHVEADDTIPLEVGR